jgi:uroporphyrinogen-III decarboxylase
MTTFAEIEHTEIERRKRTIARMWEYGKVDHIPIGVWLDDFGTYSLREQCVNGGRQFEVSVACMNRCLKNLPDDYIPYVRVWPGYMTIATMFGMEVHWGDDPNQAPGVQGHLISDMSQVYGLRKPDAREDGLMPHNIRWLDHANRRLPPDVHITGIDLGGPLNTAKDLLETNLLYTAFIDAPEAMHHLLGLAAELQAACVREIVRAAGGLERLTCTDFDPIWVPPHLKGFVSDDVCASIGPDTFAEFSIPYNNRILQGFRGGRLHNCGPNPSAHLYLNHEAETLGLNCSYRYSRADLKELKASFSGRGVIEFNFDNGESAEEIVRGFEEIAHGLSPDAIGMPVLFLDHSWSDEDLRGIYADLRGISERYAREIRWAA